jgi:hypothetical protein
MEEDEEGRADDETMDLADGAVGQVIAELEKEHGMIMPDIIIVLINAAVSLAFESWKEGGPEDAKRIIQDTVTASLETAMAKLSH